MYFRFKTLATGRPSPGLQAGRHGPATVSPDLQRALVARHRAGFDWCHGGPAGAIKYLDIHAFEYMLRETARGDLLGTLMARMTFAGALRLIDPADGGVRQCATGNGWHEAMPVKTLRGQACMLRGIALADVVFPHPANRAAYRRMLRFLDCRLRTPDGLYRTRAVETDVREHHQEERATTRTRDNAWLVTALRCGAARFRWRDLDSTSEHVLSQLLMRRRLANGGYRKFDHDRQPAFADTLAAADALRQCANDHRSVSLLDLALDTVGFIDRHYRCSAGGYADPHDANTVTGVMPDIDQNITLARLSAALYTTSGLTFVGDVACRALAYLSDPAVALARSSDSGILLADVAVRDAHRGATRQRCPQVHPVD